MAMEEPEGLQFIIDRIVNFRLRDFDSDTIFFP